MEHHFLVFFFIEIVIISYILSCFLGCQFFRCLVIFILIFFREWLVISSQWNIHPEYQNDLSQVSSMHSELLLLEPCEGHSNITLRCHKDKIYLYPDVLQVRNFVIYCRNIVDLI